MAENSSACSVINKNGEWTPKLERKMLQMIKDLIGDGCFPNGVEKWFIHRVSMKMFCQFKFDISEEMVFAKLDEMMTRFIQFGEMLKQPCLIGIMNQIELK